MVTTYGTTFLEVVNVEKFRDSRVFRVVFTRNPLRKFGNCVTAAIPSRVHHVKFAVALNNTRGIKTGDETFETGARDKFPYYPTHAYVRVL